MLGNCSSTASVIISLITFSSDLTRKRTNFRVKVPLETKVDLVSCEPSI